MTIDPTGPHPHVIGLMSPGTGPEGFAIAANGKWAAAPLIGGSGAKPSDWFYTKGSELALMSIGAGGKLSVVSRAPLGALPEGIAFSPKSDYVYVGNYIDRNLQTFHIVGGNWCRSARCLARAAGIDAGRRAITRCGEVEETVSPSPNLGPLCGPSPQGEGEKLITPADTAPSRY